LRSIAQPKWHAHKCIRANRFKNERRVRPPPSLHARAHVSRAYITQYVFNRTQGRKQWRNTDRGGCGLRALHHTTTSWTLPMYETWSSSSSSVKFVRRRLEGCRRVVVYARIFYYSSPMTTAGEHNCNTVELPNDVKRDK